MAAAKGTLERKQAKSEFVPIGAGCRHRECVFLLQRAPFYGFGGVDANQRAPCGGLSGVVECRLCAVYLRHHLRERHRSKFGGDTGSRGGGEESHYWHGAFDENERRRS